MRHEWQHLLLQHTRCFSYPPSCKPHSIQKELQSYLNKGATRTEDCLLLGRNTLCLRSNYRISCNPSITFFMLDTVTLFTSCPLPGSNIFTLKTHPQQCTVGTQTSVQGAQCPLPFPTRHKDIPLGKTGRLPLPFYFQQNAPRTLE